MYRGLAALLQSSRGLVYESRMLAAQYRDTATEVMFRQLEMANRYLDTAGLGNSGERKERCMGLATRSYERLITWADTGACADEKGAELVNRLRTPIKRLKALNVRYTGRVERRKPVPT